MINIEFKIMEVPRGITEVKFIPKEGTPLVTYMNNKELDEVSNGFRAQVLINQMLGETTEMPGEEAVERLMKKYGDNPFGG